MTAPVGRRGPRRLAAVAVLSVFALLVASCGGDGGNGGNGGGDTAGGGPAPSGEPILVGQIVPIESPSLALEEQALALEAAIESVNNRGGVNGRPLELFQCDSRGDPNREVECARQMVERGVVAAFANVLVFNTEASGQVLRDAGIPRIGDSITSVAGYSLPNVFSFVSGGALLLVGMINVLVDEGHTRISVVRPNIPQAAALVPQLLAPVARSLGAQIVNDVAIGTGATDYSQFVTAAQQNGATAAVSALGVAQANAVAEAANQLNSDLVFSLSPASYSAADLQELGGFAQNAVLTASLPAATVSYQSEPGLEQYVQDMEASGEDQLQRENLTVASERSWLAVHAFVEVMSDAQTITAESVMQAFNTATDIDMHGLTAQPWTPGQATAVGPIRNVSNPVMFGMDFNGERVRLTGQSYNVVELARAAF